MSNFSWTTLYNKGSAIKPTGDIVDAGTLNAIGEYLLSVYDEAEIAAIVPGSKNVRSYGAIGDGLADDTAAIQAVFDTAENGAAIYFPSGTYLVSGLTVKDLERIRIYGDGNGSEIKLIESSNTTLLDIYNCPRFILENLRFNGNRDNQISGGGVCVSQGEFSVIARIEIAYCKEYGLKLTGTGTGEGWNGTDEINVHNCYIYYNTGDGVLIYDTHDHTISGCNIEFNSGNGVHLQSCSCCNIVSSMLTSNEAHGIYAEEATRYNVVGSQIRNNGECGIKVMGGKQGNIVANDIHINGRIDTASFRSGILLGYTRKCHIVSNMCSNYDFTATQTYGLETYGMSESILACNTFSEHVNDTVHMDSSSYTAIANLGLDNSGVNENLSDEAANIPASGSFLGQTFYATDTTTVYFWTGSAWMPLNS